MNFRIYISLTHTLKGSVPQNGADFIGLGGRHCLPEQLPLLRAEIVFVHNNDFSIRHVINFAVSFSLIIIHYLNLCRVRFPGEWILREATNGLIRQYLPKRTNLSGLTQEQCDRIAEQLNNRPRLRLGFKTPNEVYY